jgi:hypothetical protein
MGVGWWEFAGGRFWCRREVKKRKESNEGLWKGVREDVLECRGHPYTFKYFFCFFAL